MLTNSAIIFEIQKILKDPRAVRRARTNHRCRALIKWLVFFAVLGLFIPRTAKAETADKMAHFGTSYAMNTALYSILTPSVCRNNILCGHVFSGIITSMAGLYWEFESGTVDWADVRANTWGIAASTITIRMLEYRF